MRLLVDDDVNVGGLVWIRCKRSRISWREIFSRCWSWSLEVELELLMGKEEPRLLEESRYLSACLALPNGVDHYVNVEDG